MISNLVLKMPSSTYGRSVFVDMARGEPLCFRKTISYDFKNRHKASYGFRVEGCNCPCLIWVTLKVNVENVSLVGELIYFVFVVHN